MRKIIKCITIILALCLIFAHTSVTAFAGSGDNAVIVMKGDITDNGFVVKANLVKNDGISAMVVELVYDDAALTLVGLEWGSALSSLQPITTATETDKGYSIRPFKINYSGDKNDYSRGNLFTFTFKVNENAPNGTYKVTLAYERDKSVNYYEDGDVKTRNLSVDSVEVKTKGAKPAEISTVSETNDEPSTNVLLIVSISVFALAAVMALVILITRKRKRWKKI